MTRKGFFISMGILSIIWIIGYSDNVISKPPQSQFPKPDEGKWALGYDYQKGEYIYHTEYSPLTSKPQVYFGTTRAKPGINLDRKNWTKKQLRELEPILRQLSEQSFEEEFDIEFYLDY